MSTAALTPTPKMQFSDALGVPLAGGKVYSYVAGTTNQLATFTDSTEAAQNTNPIILDAGGFANIWLGAQFYKLIVQDANGVQQYSVDNVSSYNLPFITTFNFLEGTGVISALGSDTIFGDIITHRLAMSNNGGAQDVIVGANTNDVLANKTLTAPVLISPTIDALTSTGAGTFSGNNTFSGDNTFTGKNDIKVKTLNRRVYADQFPGATADIQINAAIAALPAIGGTVDCTGYGSTTQTIASPIVVGSATKQVTMIIERATQFNITVLGGVDAIQLWVESSIIALDMGNVLAVANFVVSPAANINNVIASYPRAGPSITNIRGITIKGDAAATVGGAMIDLVGVTDKSTVQDVVVYGFKGYGLRIQNAAGGVPTGPINITNVSINGTGFAGARPVLINGVAGGGVIADINFFGGSLTHPGPGGLPILDIQGGAGNSVNGINLYGTQFESINAADIGINIVDSTGVYGSGLLFSQAVNAGAICVKISQNLGVTYNIIFDNLTNFNAWTSTLTDVINTVNLTDARLSHYTLLPPTANAHNVYGASGLIFGMSAAGVVSTKPLTVGATGTPLTLAKVYVPNLTPASVAAATVAEQTFAVTGLTTADKVVVNPPSTATAVGIAGARVSAADTLAVRYVNPTAGALVPTAGVYTIIAFRS